MSLQVRYVLRLYRCSTCSHEQQLKTKHDESCMYRCDVCGVTRVFVMEGSCDTE